jgi:hypothetical protein
MPGISGATYMRPKATVALMRSRPWGVVAECCCTAMSVFSMDSEGAPGVPQEDFAGRREAEPAGGALEEAHPKGLFEFADLLADLRPGAVQAPGRRGHAAFFDDFDETVPTGEPGHL